MKGKLLFPLAALAAIVISCSDSTTVYEETDDNVSLETSATVLENSIDFESSGVLDIYAESSNSGKYAREGEEQAVQVQPLRQEARDARSTEGSPGICETLR